MDCNDGKHCIPSWHWCDCDNDCPGGNDEVDCPSTQNVFRCKSDMSCIPRRKQCDCRLDCSDGSDEEDCSSSSFLRKETCLYCDAEETMPYPPSARCDCIKDCPDGQDEESCDNDIMNQRFECADGNGCVHWKDVCSCESTSANCSASSKENCADLSDENLPLCSSKCSPFPPFYLCTLPPNQNGP